MVPYAVRITIDGRSARRPSARRGGGGYEPIQAEHSRIRFVASSKLQKLTHAATSIIVGARIRGSLKLSDPDFAGDAPGFWKVTARRNPVSDQLRTDSVAPPAVQTRLDSSRDLADQVGNKHGARLLLLTVDPASGFLRSAFCGNSILGDPLSHILVCAVPILDMSGRC
jgi:hypothetical protein